MKTDYGLGLIIIAAVSVELLVFAQFRFLQSKLREELATHTELELASSAKVILHTLSSAEATMQENLWNIRRLMPEPDSMFNATRHLIEHNPILVGGCIAFTPYYYPSKGRLFEPYAEKRSEKITVRQIASAGHDYTRHPSYKQVSSTGEPEWSTPYIYEDKGVSQKLTTYTAPVFNDDGEIAAVVGIDIDLSWLGDTLNAQCTNPSTFALILTRDGDLVVTPEEHEADLDVVVSLIREDFEEKTDIIRSKAFRSKGVFDKGYVYYTSLKGDPQWIVAMVFYDREVYAGLHRMRRYNAIFIFLGFLILALIVQSTAKARRKLHEANLEKARIGGELKAAQAIQKEMLPKTFPPYPDHREIDIYGTLAPAKEVGGDLFDFFLRDSKLYFCIGDVSGKGIPAALVMSVTHTLFRTVSASEDDPAAIIRAINESICKENKTGMFVTFFLGILDLGTGQLRWCNAGHEHPVMLGEEVKKMDMKANLPVGTFSDFNFVPEEGFLPEGSTLFLYTDGLTEARDSSRKTFTIQRVLSTLEANKDKDATMLIEAVQKSVSAFTGDAEQSDDLTLLAIRRTPSAGVAPITLDNDLSEVGRLGKWVKELTTGLGMEIRQASAIRLAIEEIVVNVINYAYPEGQRGTVSLNAALEGNSLLITIRDNGIPFDPTSAEPADTTLPSEERSIGGLGIHLARNLSDEISYKRINNQNILTIKKTL